MKVDEVLFVLPRKHEILGVDAVGECILANAGGFGFSAGGFVLRTVAHGESPLIGPGNVRYPPFCTVECVDICQGICHEVTMSERHVKLFKNGRNQAVRIPREFELPGEDAIIRKEGQRLIIEAAPPRSLLAVLATLQTLDESFPLIEDPPAEPVDL